MTLLLGVNEGTAEIPVNKKKAFIQDKKRGFNNLSENSSLNSKALESPMQATIRMKVFIFLFYSKQRRMK